MGIITLGPKGTFSHEAAKRLFPKKKLTFASSIDELFFRLSDSQFSEGVIPMENSLSDFVGETIGNLMKYDFPLTQKIPLHVSYLLAGFDKEIDTLFAHPHAFKQCRRSLHLHYPGAKLIETKSNAYSAIQWLAHPKKSGALVPSFAPNYYDLPILAEKMEDDEDNYTTFYAIGKSPVSKKKEKQGSAFLLFSEPMVTTTKQISTLCHEKKIPLLKLKDFLLQEGETPLYFVEIEGHIEDKMVHSLFKELSEKFLIKYLGSYELISLL
ncbi:MAG: hypothetical protein KDK76_07070 [Chlamydiia bacterium]|nr:hypothetical protein [Chlamydiia bacterium]